MKILVDENIPRLTAAELRQLGHEVLDIRGSTMAGADDEVLWSLAKSQERLLITTDKGFARHRAETHCGLLIVRLRQPNLERIHARILAVLRQVAPTAWPGRLVVVRDTVQSTWRFKTRHKGKRS